MYRLLVLVFSIIIIVSWQPASAASNHIVELGKPTKASLEVIGKKPPKRFIELDLGDLRTRSALLPDGERDLKARIRLRNRRALERQKAATKTKRKKRKKNNPVETDDGGSETPDEEVKENEAESENVEKKVAKASKKKRKKKRKKKKRKKRSGGSGSGPELNTNPTQPVNIE